ncbi:hypothetical protein AHAS_Ahas01G0138500 [Arachis hypogaea]
MYKLITQHRKKKVKDGNANIAISYLRGKAGNDSFFFGKYTLSNENRLENLFWDDGTSRIDYECFGHVLTFDLTYNRNVYNKPHVIFSSSNHHGQTIIFGCGILVNEDITAKTFIRNMFREVRKEIEGACAMNTELVIQDGGKLYFKCNSFGVPEIDYMVEFDRVGGMLRCKCLWFENRVIPYMHIFACLKHQHVEVIPECLVCKRWMKNAKSDFMKSNVDDPSDSNKVLKCRLGVLAVECSRLMDVACKNSSDFVEAMNDVVNIITKLQK